MKTVIFDMHGVIMKEPDGSLMPFVNRTFPHKTKDEVYPICAEAEYGKITPDNFFRLVGYRGDLGEIGRSYLETIEIDEGFMPCALLLKKSRRLALLSNDISEWSGYIRKKYGLDGLFDAIIISGDVGVKKPSPDIYRIALEKLGQPAAECVFIDDRPSNLTPAVGLGMETILFDRGGSDYCGKKVRSFGELADVLNLL